METTLRAFPALSAVRPCNSLRYWRTADQSLWLAPYRYSPGDIPSRNLQLQTANRSLGFLTSEIPATCKKMKKKNDFSRLAPIAEFIVITSGCNLSVSMLTIKVRVASAWLPWQWSHHVFRNSLRCGKYQLLQELPTKYKKRKNEENQDSFDFFCNMHIFRPDRHAE